MEKLNWMEGRKGGKKLNKIKHKTITIKVTGFSH